jgi:ribosomal protein S18 acetylase RimI-like enzyme
MDSTCELLAEKMSVTLRPVGPDDEAFLFDVYASTRRKELAVAGWDTQQEQDFLRKQFDAQARYYGSEYPGAKFFVILVESTPAGRLYVHDRQKETRVMDIALLPDYRGRGIGSSLLRPNPRGGRGPGQSGDDSRRGF